MASEAALADEVLAACFGRLSLRSQPRIARVSRRWRDAAALAFARRLRWRKKARAARLPLPVRAVPGRDAAPRNEILNVGFSLEFLGGGDLVVQVVDRTRAPAADGHFLFHVTTAAGAKVAASLPLPASIAADGAVDGAVPAAFAVRWPKDDPIARPGLSREKPCGEYRSGETRRLAASSAVAAAFGRGGVEENIAYTRGGGGVLAAARLPPPAVIVWDWETGVCLQAAVLDGLPPKPPPPPWGGEPPLRFAAGRRGRVPRGAGWAPGVVLALRPDDESPYLVRLEGLGDCLAPVDSARVIRSRAGGEERRWNQRTCAFEVAASVSLALHPRAARVAVGLWHECKAAGVVYAVDFG
ncbi:hypothetical protein JL721_782 [Aureococcus anophagefferens]|nr:hypothetical protein JL721_782 [Aureococcus anophagefferens]